MNLQNLLATSTLCLVLIVLAMGCGSGYDPAYRIPVNSPLQKFEAPDSDDLVEDQGFLEGEDEEEEEEEEEGEEEEGADAPAQPAQPAAAPAKPSGN